MGGKPRSAAFRKIESGLRDAIDRHKESKSYKFRGAPRSTKEELRREAEEIPKLVETLLGFSHEGRFRILRALSAYFRSYNGDIR
jgi:hypothetical protein